MQKGEASAERDERSCLQQGSQSHQHSCRCMALPWACRSRAALGTDHQELLHHGRCSHSRLEAHQAASVWEMGIWVPAGGGKDWIVFCYLEMEILGCWIKVKLLSLCRAWLVSWPVEIIEAENTWCKRWCLHHVLLGILFQMSLKVLSSVKGKVSWT